MHVRDSFRVFLIWLCRFRYGEMYEAFSKLDSHVRIWVPEDFDYQCICVSPRCEELMEYLKKSGQLIQ